MAITDWFKRTTHIEVKELTNQPPEESAEKPQRNAVGVIGGNTDGLFKAFAPDYLYNPPYGRPRKADVILMRNLCKNAFIASVVWTLSDEVANTEYDIVLKKQYMKDGKPMVDKEADRQKILEWFSNPNGNEESFNQILKKVTTDVLEIESGVMIKVFDGKGEFQQLLAVDGSTILKNPDQYGYYGYRDEIIPWFSFQWDQKMHQYVKVPIFKGKNDLDRYQMKDRAAYFQYGNYIGFPVPFGRREIVYISRHTRTDQTYARSAVEILGDVLYTLIYGSAYNNAFYVNNNIPDGVISIINASGTEIQEFKEQFYQNYKARDSFGNTVKQFFKVPFTNAEVKFTPFALTPETMQILQQQQWFIRLVWACFGVTPDEMGFTDSTGSKNVSKEQTTVHKRKVIEPLLRLIEYHINTQIITEFGVPELEFKFREFDLDEETKKYTLYQLMLNTSLATVNELRAKEGLGPIEGGDKAGFQRQEEQFKQGGGFSFGKEPSNDKEKNDDADVPEEINKPDDAEEKSLSSIKKEEERIADPLEALYNDASKKIAAVVRTLDNDVLSTVG